MFQISYFIFLYWYIYQNLFFFNNINSLVRFTIFFIAKYLDIALFISICKMCRIMLTYIFYLLIYITSSQFCNALHNDLWNFATKYGFFIDTTYNANGYEMKHVFNMLDHLLKSMIYTVIKHRYLKGSGIWSFLLGS